MPGGRAGWNGCGAPVVPGVAGLALGVLSRWSVLRLYPGAGRPTIAGATIVGGAAVVAVVVAPAVPGVGSGTTAQTSSSNPGVPLVQMVNHHVQAWGCPGTFDQTSRTSLGLAHSRNVCCQFTRVTGSTVFCCQFPRATGSTDCLLPVRHVKCQHFVQFGALPAQKCCHFTPCNWQL